MRMKIYFLAFIQNNVVVLFYPISSLCKAPFHKKRKEKKNSYSYDILRINSPMLKLTCVHVQSLEHVYSFNICSQVCSCVTLFSSRCHCCVRFSSGCHRPVLGCMFEHEDPGMASFHRIELSPVKLTKLLNMELNHTHILLN